MIRRCLMAVTIGIVALPIASLMFARHFFMPALAVMFCVHAVAAYATFVPGNQIWGPARTSFHAAGAQVWLTIDDGPAHDTEAFLEILRKHHAKATFFIVGTQEERFRDDLRRIAADGHELACHTETHPAGWFWAYGRRAVRREIERCNERIEQAGAGRVRWFRPPVGFRNGWAHDVLEEKGLELVSWSRRGFDGIESGDPGKTVARITANLRPGDIIMIHQGRPSSPVILETLLEELARRGYECVIPE